MIQRTARQDELYRNVRAWLEKKRRRRLDPYALEAGARGAQHGISAALIEPPVYGTPPGGNDVAPPGAPPVLPIKGQSATIQTFPDLVPIVIGMPGTVPHSPTSDDAQNLNRLIVGRGAFWDKSVPVAGFDLGDFTVITGTWALAAGDLRNTVLGAGPGPLSQIVYRSCLGYGDVTITAQNQNAADIGGVLLRWDPATFSGYHLVKRGAGQIRLNRWDAGVATVLTTQICAAWVAGDNFTLKAIGSNLMIFKDGAFIITVADATYARGAVGLSADTVNVDFMSVTITDRPTT